MPELPEVETVCRGLRPWLTGRTILRARRADAPAGPKYANLEEADGKRIVAVRRRGKFVVMPLSGGDELVVHLGMTGQLLRDEPPGHLRVKVELDPGPSPVLWFRDIRRFGRFVLCRGGDHSSLPTLNTMGPEPLDSGFTAEVLRAGLTSRSAIKTALLSQRPVAGLGNIYVDEALFRARIHPLTSANAVSPRKVGALHTAIVEVLKAAVEGGGTSLRDYRNVDGEQGEFKSSLLAYGRGGEPCVRCEQPLTKLVVQQRTTVFCAKCQRR